MPHTLLPPTFPPQMAHHYKRAAAQMSCGNGEANHSHTCLAKSCGQEKKPSAPGFAPVRRRRSFQFRGGGEYRRKVCIQSSGLPPPVQQPLIFSPFVPMVGRPWTDLEGMETAIQSPRGGCPPATGSAHYCCCWCWPQSLRPDIVPGKIPSQQFQHGNTRTNRPTKSK